MLSSGNDKFRLGDCLNQYGYVDWSQPKSKDIEVGDLVLIYISKPIGRVKYLMKVSKRYMPFKETTDNKEYWIDQTIYEKGVKNNIYYRLKFQKELEDDDRLTYYALSHNGLGNVQGMQKLVGEKLSYFQKIEILK